MRRHAQPLLGVTYLVVIASLLFASVQTFRKEMPWQDAVSVTIATQSVGLELNPLSDVKLQGTRVGEVRSITSDGESAVVHLALDPDTIDLIPARVDARILPKTLFGEKYVDLVVPDDAGEARIAEGDEIRQSRTSVELGELFGRLVPMLRKLEPEKVSVLLGSLAEALDGRGRKIARTVVELDELLERVNPHIGTLTHDLRQLARVADRYADGAPDLLRILGDAAVISNELLVPEEEQLAGLLDSVIGTADLSADVVRENTHDLVTLSGRARPVLRLLDEYSVALPCTLDALHVLGDLGTHATGARGPFINLRVDLVTSREPYRHPEDLPSSPGSAANVANLHPYTPSWRPHCPQVPARLQGLGPAKLASQPAPQALPRASVEERGAPAGTAPSRAPTRPVDADPAVHEARDALARALAARSLGVPSDQVPGYVGVLLGPLLAEGQVQVR